MRRWSLSFILALTLALTACMGGRTADAMTAPASAITAEGWSGLVLAQAATPAPAATDTASSTDGKVTFDASSIIDWFAKLAVGAVGLAITYGLTLVSGPAAGILHTLQFDRAMKKAAQAGIAQAAERIEKRLGPNGEITIPVKSAAGEIALEYLNKYTNKAILDFGEPNAEKMLTRVEEIINSTLTNYVDANTGAGKPVAEAKANVNIKQPVPATKVARK